MGLTKNYIVNYDIQARVDSAINNIGRLRTAVEQLYGFDQKTKVFRGFTALNKSISDIESKLVRLNELSKTITPTVSIDLVKFDRQLQLMQRSVQGAAAKMRQAIQSALVGSNDDFMKAQRGLSGSSVAKAAQSMMAQYMKGYDEQIAAIEKGIAAHEQTIKNLSTSSARVLKAGVTGEDLKKLKKEADERARKANEDEIKREVRRQKLAKKDLENKVSERAAVQKAFREVMGYSPLIDEVNRPEILPSIKTMREMQKKISASLAAPYSATDPFFEKSKKSRDKILKNQQSQLNTWKTAQREWIMSARYGVQTISEMNRNVPMENLKVLADSLMGKEFSARVRLVPDLSMVDELLKKPFDARVNVRPVNIEKLKTDIEAIKPVIKADVVTEDKKKGKGVGTKAKGKTTETVVTEAAKKGAALTQSKTAKVMETFGTFITNITSKPIDINVSLIPDIAALKAKLAEAKVDVPASLKINTEMLAKNLAKMKPVTIPVIAQEKPGAKGKAKTKAVETVNANLNFTPNIEGVKEALKLASLTANVALNGDIPALDKKIKAYKFSANVSLTPLMGDIEKALGKIAVPATTPTKGKTPATKQPAKQATAKPMSFPKLTVAEEELMNKLFATFPKLSKDQETAGKRMVAAQNKVQQSSTEANLAALKNAEDKYGIARKKYTEAFNKLRPLMVKQFQSTATRLLTDEEALKGYEAQNLVSTLSAKKTLTKAQKQQLDEANKTLTALRAPEKVKAPTATKPVTVTAKTDDLKKTVAAANLSSNVKLTADIKALKEKVAATKLSAKVELTPDTKALKTKAVETVNANLNFTPNIEGVKEALKLASLTANVALNGDIPALDKKIKAHKFSANVSLTPLMGDIEKALGKIAVPATTPTRGKTPATKQPAKQATAKPMSFPKLTVAEEELMNKLFTTFPKLSKEQETAAKRMSAAQKKLQSNNTETNVAALRNAEEKFTQARQKYTEAFKQLRPLMVKQFQSTASRILTEQEALKGFEAQNTVSMLSAKKNLTKAQKTQLEEARKTLTALRAPEKTVTPPVKKQVPLKGDVSGLKKSVENAKLSSGVNLTPDLNTLTEKVKAAKLSVSVKLNPDMKELRERVKAAKLSANITLTPNIKELNEKVKAGKLSAGVNLTPNTKELKEKTLAAKLQANVSLTGDIRALKEKVTAAKLTANASISPNVTELKEKLAAYKSLSASVKLKGYLKGLDTQVKAAKLTAKVSLTPIMTAIEEKLASLTANVSLKAQQTGTQTQNTTTIIPAPTGGTATGTNTTATTTTTTTTNSSGNKKSSKSKLPPKTSWGARYANDTDYQKERFALLNKQNALAAAYRNQASEYIARLGFNQVQSSVLVPLRKYFSKAAGMTNIPVENGGLNSMQQFQVVDQARRLMLANDNIKIPPIFEEVHGRLMGEAAAMAAVVKKPAPVVTPPTSPVSKKDSFGKKYAGDASYQRERLSLLKTQGENAQILREISSDYIKRLGFTQGEANSLVSYRKFINKAVEMTGVNLKKTGMTDNARFRVLDQARLLMKASGVAVPKIIDQKFNDIFAKNRNIGAAERERTRVNRTDQIQRLQARGYNFMSQFTGSPTEAQTLLKYRHYFTRGADLAGVTPSANLSQRHLLELLQGTKMVMEDKGVAVPPAITRRIADIEKAMQARTRENRVAKVQRLRNDYISKLSSWASSRAEQNELLQYRHYFDRALKAYGMNHPSQLRFATTGTQFNVMLETKNLMARRGVEFPIAMRKRMDSLYDKMHAESLKEQEALLAQRKAENTAAHMKRYNKAYANAVINASQFAPTFREQGELIKYRKFFKQASKELGFTEQNLPKTMQDQLKVMQSAQQKMANSGIVSSILNNRISDTQRRMAAEDERAAMANSRMVPLPVGNKKSFYDRLRGWSYPFTGNTSFGARTPVAYDMMKGMGMMYGVGGAMGVISEAFSNSVEYQNTMETAKAILQRNYNGNNFKSDYDKMIRTVRDVAMKTKFTAPEAADAARFMAMAGLDIPMIKASIAPIADLAVIGDNDLGFIADKMTNIQTAFGIAPQQMRKVADMMTSTITSTNTDIAMLAESMEYAAPMARMANWKKGASGSLAEALAIIGVMGNSGIQASMAGTTLRMMYQNIMKTTKDQRKAWQSLGISLKEEDGSPRNMISLLDELANKIDITSNKGKAKLPGLMSQLFRVTAGPGAAAIVQNIDKVKALAAQNMAATGNSQAISMVKQSDIKGLWAQVTSAFTEGVLKVFESAETQKYINEKLKGGIKFLQSPEFVKMMKDVGDLVKSIAEPMMMFVKYWVWLFRNFGGIIKYVVVAQTFLTQIGYLLVPFNQLVGVVSKLGGLITGVGKSFEWLFNIMKAGKAVQAASAVTNAATTATSGVAGAAGAAVAGAARGAAAGATSAAAGAAGSAAATAATMTMWQKMRAPISKFFKVIFSPLTIAGSAMFGWMKKMFAPFGNIAHQFRLFNRWGMMNNVEFYGKRGLGGFMKVTGAAGASLIRGIGAVVTRLGVIGLAVGAIYGIGKMIYNTYEQRRKTNEAIAAKQKQLSTYGNVIANNALVYNEKTGAAGRNLMQRWSPVAQGVQMNPQIPTPTRSVMSNVGANLASRKKTPLNQIKQFKPLFTNWDDNYNRLIAPTELAKQYEVYYKGNLAIMNGKDKSMTFDAMVRAANNIQRYDGEKRADYVRRKNDAIRNMIAKGAVYHFGANSMEVQAALNQINELFKAAGEDKEKIEKAKEQANKIAEQFNPQNKYIKNNTKNAKSYAEIGRSGDLSEYREWWTGAYNTLKNAIGGSNDLFAYYNSMFNLVDNKYALGNIDNLINSTILRIPNVNGQMQSLMLKIQNGSPVWTDFYDQCRKLNITFNNGVLEHCNILDGIMKTLVKMPELQPFIAEIQRVIERMKKESVKYDKLLHPFAKQYGVEDGTLVDQGYGIDSWVKNGSPYEKPGKTQIPFAPNDEVPKQKVPDKKPISILKPEDEGNNNDLPKPIWARKASMTFGGNDGATIPAQSLGQGKPMVNLNINFGDIRVEGGADQYQIAAQIESYLITALSTLKDKIGAAVVEPGNMQGSGFTTAMM